jgi:hypothetical protein
MLVMLGFLGLIYPERESVMKIENTSLIIIVTIIKSYHSLNVS